MRILQLKDKEVFMTLRAIQKQIKWAERIGHDYLKDDLKNIEKKLERIQAKIDSGA